MKKAMLAVGAFALMLLFLFTFVLHPFTLTFDVHNVDEVQHNVTVKIFRDEKIVFERRYTIKPELSVYENTGLLWGEYVVEINLDGKIYRYEVKVKPGFRISPIGGTLLLLTIENSSIAPKILGEGPPYLEFVEFEEGNIFEEKFLFLAICEVPSEGESNYRFDEKSRVIYAKNVPFKINESLKAVVGVGADRYTYLKPPTSFSYLEPIYALPYAVHVNGFKVEITEINEYGTVKLRFGDGRAVSIQRDRSWIETLDGKRVLIVNYGFLNKSGGVVRSNFVFIEVFGIPVPKEKLEEMGCDPLWAHYVDFPVYSFDKSRGVIEPNVAPKGYFDEIDFEKLKVLVGAGVIGYVSGISSKLVPIYEFPSEFRIAGLRIELLGLKDDGTIVLTFRNETIELPPNSTVSVKIRECGEKLVFRNHGFLDRMGNERSLKG